MNSLFSYSTIARQLQGKGEVSATMVVALARAYELNPISALVAADFITPEEAENPDTLNALNSASDVELAEEILRRARGDQDSILNDPINVSGMSNTGRQQDYDLVSHPYTEETGELMDE